MLGVGEVSLLCYVVLFGVLLYIFMGLVVGMGVVWVLLIVVEMIFGQFGIGYFIWEVYLLISYVEIVFGMIMIGVLGLFCSGVICLFVCLVMFWQVYFIGGC